jgi:hypothetical protein
MLSSDTIIRVHYEEAYFIFHKLERSRVQLNKVRVRFTLRLVVYRQPICLGDNPLRFTTSIFFSNEHLRSQSLCNIVSNERMGLPFTTAADPRHCSHSQVPVTRDSRPHFYCLRFETPPNLEGQVPVHVAQSYCNNNTS